jgi:hypothetical protein
VEVQHDWSEEQMKRADESLWFTCPVHGHRLPELRVRIVRFSFEGPLGPPDQTAAGQ